MTLKMENLVSIITPCYNCENFISYTIQSVISQTYKHWEMIIVDDCSDDQSAEIILSFAKKDSRIKYIKTDFPSGSPAKPRNIAIENAKGRYIAFLDSDDLWLPNKLENQVHILESNGNAAIAFSYYEKVNEEGVKSGIIIKSPQSLTYKQLLFGNVIGNLTGVYDTKKTGKVYLKNKGHEDYILWLEILKTGFVALNTNTVEALYRVRTNSISANKFKALKWTWNIYRHVENFNLTKSLYYFSFYAVKSLIKILK